MRPIVSSSSTGSPLGPVYEKPRPRRCRRIPGPSLDTRRNRVIALKVLPEGPAAKPRTDAWTSLPRVPPLDDEPTSEEEEPWTHSRC